MGTCSGGSENPAVPPEPDGRGEVWRLAVVFGVLSFLQGVIEPTEGLLAQPIRSRLLGWGRGPGEVGGFVAVVGLPWALKPLLGVLSDVFPFWGSRRRGYVVAAGAVAALAFLTLAVVPGAGESPTGLLAGLFVASAATAMADVATDAMAVDRGQADGRTGRYQASQWFCLCASGVATGTVGGTLSTAGRAPFALYTCALASALMLAVAALGVREPPAARGKNVLEGLGNGVRWPGVLAVAGFLAIGSFSPFASSVLLHLHMTGALGFSEQFFGHTISIFAGASMTAAAFYGIFGRKLPVRVLGFASVVFGALSNLVYVGLVGYRSAVIVTLIAGLASMTATLIQLELAARACHPAATGTVFATFMAVSNLSTTIATWLAGTVYESVGGSRDRVAAFHVLVLAGAASLSLGVLLVPFLPGGPCGNETKSEV